MKLFLFILDFVFGWDSNEESGAGENGSSHSFAQYRTADEAEFRRWVGTVCAGGPSGFGSTEMDSVFR